ncbi:MAG: oligosaccharide flippase family protein [Saprospiraceae bacterium]
MKKAFFINIVILLAANLMIKPLYVFGIDRTVQNIVGSEIYGIYITLFSLTMLFQIVSDFGIRYLNNRDIAQHQQLFKKYFSNLLVLKGIQAVAFTGVCYLTAFFLGYNQYYVSLLSIMIISQLLTDFVLYLRSSVSGLQYYLQDSLLSISDKLLMIIFCGILIFKNPFDAPFQIEWLVYAQILASTITVIFSLFVIRKHLKGIRFKFNLPFLIVILKRTWSYALAVFLMSVYFRMDVIIMERILPDGANENGIYYQAYRLISAMNMIGVLFSGLLFPMFARLLKEKKPIGDLLAFSFQFLYAMLIVASVNIMFFSEPIMVTLYDEGNAYSGQILALLIISFIGTGSSYIFGSLLTANENLKELNIFYFTTMVLNIIFNFIFISQYKALGAAGVTLFTQFFVLFGLIFLTVRNFEISFNIRLIIRVILFTISVIISSYFVLNWITLDWITQLGLATGIGIILSFLFKLIDIKGIIQIMKER